MPKGKKFDAAEKHQISSLLAYNKPPILICQKGMERKDQRIRRGQCPIT